MGVTLERVQNKFACIIGELCSEPLILSQFAIWVDLRIAEYKAKGAISLDCSGEKPSPTWLKGIQPLPGEENPSLDRRHDITTSRNARRKAHNYANDESVSPVTFEASALDSSRLVVEDAFSVKQELCRDEEVFPVGVIHPHHSSAQRKRTVEEERDILNSDNSIFPSGSPAKCRRLSSDKATDITTERENSTANQSLMSVINAQDLQNVSTLLNEDSQTLDYDRGDNSSDLSYIAETSRQLHSHSAAVASNQTARVGFSDRRWTPKECGHLNSEKMLKPQAASLTAGTAKKPNTIGGESTIIQQEPSSMPSEQAGESPSTMRNTLYAVGTFERWLMLKKGVAAKMERIEPPLLDEYLVQFFNTAKRPSGEDYRHGSIRLLRERFERYLKHHGYPYSLVSSSVFHNSQVAFRERKKYLKLVETMQGNVNEQLLAEGSSK